MTLGLVGMLIFSRLTPTSSYASGVLPGLLVVGLGMGCIFAPAMGTATLGVELHETGVASAIVNTGQQIGGSVGLALLSAFAASASSNYLKSHRGASGLASAAAVHGYTTSFIWSAAIFGLGLVLALLILPRKAGLPACSLKTALARGLAYAHHTEPADPVIPPA
jgi:MFS family permease